MAHASDHDDDSKNDNRYGIMIVTMTTILIGVSDLCQYWHYCCMREWESERLCLIIATITMVIITTILIVVSNSSI